MLNNTNTSLILPTDICVTNLQWLVEQVLSEYDHYYMIITKY